MSLTAEKLRELIKDKPELNILLENQEQSGDPLIQSAMSMAVSDFNSMPPIIRNYTVEDFPNEAILFYGTLHYIANGEAERQLRNQVQYNAQGLNAGIDDKFGQYSQLAQYYGQLFNNKASQFKKMKNIDAAWGQQESPYLHINEYNFGS